MADKVDEMVYAPVQDVFRRSRHISPVWFCQNIHQHIFPQCNLRVAHLEMDIRMAYRRYKLDVRWRQRIVVWYSDVELPKAICDTRRKESQQSDSSREFWTAWPRKLARYRNCLPSYALPGTPFITASQCRISDSETGPSWRRAGLGSLGYDWSSLRRRFVDGGVLKRVMADITGLF